jgi:BirA family biotin operon repressor/biotin-[acetyl-CoA-carboxylase] ligase
MTLTVEQCEDVKRETFIEHIETHERLPSTSDLALQRADQDPQKAPLLIVAEHQTAGRGRGSNPWWSEAGALTFSLLIDCPPALADPQRLSLASLAVGVAVCEAIQKLSPELDAGLKWPNDVFVSDRKLAGILIETVTRPNRMLVIGIGMNVNNSIHSAPVELQGQATSLIDLTQGSHDCPQLLLSILKQIEHQLHQLEHNPDQLRQRWTDLCILNGKTVTLLVGEKQYVGVCKGMDDNGALIIQTESGPVTCSTGVVKSFVAP